MNGYVLTRDVESGAYALWSFDPQADIPLAHPAVQRGTWASIDREHRLVPIGDFVLDWVPSDRSYRLWWFDPKRPDPLCGPVRVGHLPEAFTPELETARRSDHAGGRPGPRPHARHDRLHALEDQACRLLHAREPVLRPRARLALRAWRCRHSLDWPEPAPSRAPAPNITTATATSGFI